MQTVKLEAFPVLIYRLQRAYNFLKCTCNPPLCILVTGAGTAHFNGYYHISGYQGFGRCNDQIFPIHYYSHTGNGGGYGIITLVGSYIYGVSDWWLWNFEAHQDAPGAFYSGQGAPGCIAPPLTGWGPVLGQAPGPTLTFFDTPCYYYSIGDDIEIEEEFFP